MSFEVSVVKLAGSTMAILRSVSIKELLREIHKISK